MTGVQTCALPICYLNIENAPDKPPCEIIWEHDERIMEDALAFYAHFSELSGATDWSEVQSLLAADANEKVAPGDPELWSACQAAHCGFQVGLDILLLIPTIGIASEFAAIEVGEDFTVTFPAMFAAEIGRAHV